MESNNGKTYITISLDRLCRNKTTLGTILSLAQQNNHRLYVVFWRANKFVSEFTTEFIADALGVQQTDTFQPYLEELATFYNTSRSFGRMAMHYPLFFLADVCPPNLSDATESSVLVDEEFVTAMRAGQHWIAHDRITVPDTLTRQPDDGTRGFTQTTLSEWQSWIKQALPNVSKILVAHAAASSLQNRSCLCPAQKRDITEHNATCFCLCQYCDARRQMECPWRCSSRLSLPRHLPLHLSRLPRKEDRSSAVKMPKLSLSQ